MKVSGPINPGLERILVLVEEKKDELSQGFYLPDGQDKELLIGRVLSVGSAKHTDSTSVEPCQANDQILFEKWAGRDFEGDEGKLKIINYDDVLAIIEEK